MTQEIKDIGSYIARTFTLGGSTEAKSWQRTFPPEMPEGWYLHVEWIGPLELLIVPRQKSIDPATATPIESASKLNTMTLADLNTLAAEQGVETKNKTREQVTAALAAKK